jgi:Sec7-like guanine-nucleotide exchange factor
MEMEGYDIIFRRLNFGNKDIVESLRIVMKSFNEKKTSIDEYIREFSKAFIRDNPGNKEIENEEIAYNLSISIILLDNDLHNSTIKNKITLEQFIWCNTDINYKKILSDYYLNKIYESVKNKKIK